MGSETCMSAMSGRETRVGFMMALYEILRVSLVHELPDTHHAALVAPGENA